VPIPTSTPSQARAIPVRRTGSPRRRFSRFSCCCLLRAMSVRGDFAVEPRRVLLLVATKVLRSELSVRPPNRNDGRMSHSLRGSPEESRPGVPTFRGVGVLLGRASGWACSCARGRSRSGSAGLRRLPRTTWHAAWLRGLRPLARLLRPLRDRPSSPPGRPKDGRARHGSTARNRAAWSRRALWAGHSAGRNRCTRTRNLRVARQSTQARGA